MIVLRAIDETCLDLPAPMSADRSVWSGRVGCLLSHMLARLASSADDLAMHDEHVFAEYSGVVGEHREGQPLGQRRNEAMYVTRHRKLLLVWTWIAADTAGLSSMPKTSVRFEDETPIELARQRWWPSDEAPVRLLGRLGWSGRFRWRGRLGRSDRLR